MKEKKIRSKTVTFKGYSPKKDRIIVCVTLGDGTSKETETYWYNRATNKVVLSESFEFTTEDFLKNAYFTLKLYQVGEGASASREFICKKLVSLNESLEDHNYTLTIPIETGGEAFWHFNVHMSEEFKHSFMLFDDNEKEEHGGSIWKQQQLKLLLMGPLYQKFIKAITPFVYAAEFWDDVRAWNSVPKTLLFSVVFTFFVLYWQDLALIFFITFLVFSSSIIGRFAKTRFNFPQQAKVELYLRNLTFIHNFMNNVCFVREKVDMFLANDRSSSLELLLRFKNLNLIVIVFLWQCSVTELIIIIYWIIITAHTDLGKSVYSYFFFNAEKVGQHIHEIVEKNINIQRFNKSHFTLVASSSCKSVSHRDTMVIESKKFTIFENERWWVGNGWLKTLLPGERPAWSDVEGLIECTKDHFKLPSDEWEWDGDWIVIKDITVDEDGWEYAVKFQKKFHKVQNAVDFVRRRRWTRRCIKKMIIPPLSISTDDGRLSIGNSQRISGRFSYSVNDTICDEEVTTQKSSPRKVRETIIIKTKAMLE